MLNFSQFKKVSEDDKEAILSHPEGHKIHLAKANLSKPVLQQLKALPLHQADPKDAVPDLKDFPPESDGTVHVEDDPSASPAPAIERSMELTGNTVPGTQPSGLPTDKDYRAMQGAPTTLPAPLSGQSDQSSNPLAQPTQEDLAKDLPNQLGYSKQSQAIEDAAKAKGTLGDAEAKIYGRSALAEESAAKEIRSSLQATTDEIGNLRQDILDNHIKPNAYMENMSVPNKIATAIGLILGGVSSGQTGQANPAAAFLHQQIERDLAAQKANQDTKQNLLSALEKQYGDKMVAANVFRAMRASQVGAQLGQAAASSQNPLGKAAALQAQGSLEQAYAPGLIQSHILKVLNGPTGQALSPESNLQLRLQGGLIKEDQYKEGVKELAKAEEVEKLRSNLQSSFNDLSSKALGGRLSPIDRDSAIQAFAGAITHVTEGRVNFEAAQRQVKALLPEGIEADSTRALKQQRLDQVVDQFHTTPILSSMGITIPKAKAPAAPVSRGGKMYVPSASGKGMVPQ